MAYYRCRISDLWAIEGKGLWEKNIILMQVISEETSLRPLRHLKAVVYTGTGIKGNI